MVDPGFDVALIDYQAGRIGKLPEWVRVMQAAKHMGVAPWELIRQNDIWTDWALFLQQVTSEAQEAQTKRSSSSASTP